MRQDSLIEATKIKVRKIQFDRAPNAVNGALVHYSSPLEINGVGQLPPVGHAIRAFYVFLN